MPHHIQGCCALVWCVVVLSCGGDVTGSSPPAAVVALAGDDQVGIGLAALPEEIVVRVQDASGGAVANVAVSFQASGGGSVAMPTVSTDPQGDASVRWTLGQPGTVQSLTATVADVTPATFTATATVAWVAAGCCDANSIVTSMDGITWTARTARFEEAFAVAFNGRQWIAAGEQPGGSAMLATSPDGITWTDRTVPHGNLVFGVAWNGSQWLATGCCDNDVATSTDGVTWTPHETPFEYLWGVAASETRWVATGPSPDGHTIATSTDGMNWSPFAGGPAEEGVAVAWNGAHWMVSDLDAGTVYTSPDATTWTPRETGLSGSRAIAWDGARWLVTGLQGIALSADAEDFAVHPTGLGSTLAAAWSGSLWVVAGTAIATHRIATSPDGVAWTTRASPLLTGYAVAYARPLFPSY